MNKYILCVILSLSTIIFTSCNTLNSDLKNKNINISTVDNSPNENKNNINNIKSDYVFKAKVIKSNDNNFLITGLEDNYNSLYTISSSTNYDLIPKPGDIIEVGFNGNILETYPGQLGQCDYIKVIEHSDDMVGLYFDIFQTLLNKDPGLNENISIIAFDLSKASNITESEKNALYYIISNEYNVETISSTYDELCNEGFIDKDKNYFKDGILLSLEITDELQDSFKFNTQKWRSGLGAYFLDSCVATKYNGVWSFTIGSEAIS